MTPPPVSIPPTNSARPPRALSNPPQMSQPALSMPIVRRPWGLIAIVVVVDLALAATGAVLLAKGLSKSEKSAPTPAPAPAAAAPAPAPAPAVTPIDAGSATAAAEPPPPPSPAPAREDKKESPKVEAKKPPPAKKGGSKLTGGPEDPYGPAELNNEVELNASRSQAGFAKCAHDADATAPVHGDIKIAFQVLPSGRVTNAQPVVNSTGSPALASCLVSIMVRWSFAAKPAATTDFVRPFSYP
jgi:TonB family protein